MIRIRATRCIRAMGFGALMLLCCLQPRAATETFQYRYDSAGRLIEARSQSALLTYQYDASGTVILQQSGPNPVLFADSFEGNLP